MSDFDASEYERRLAKAHQLMQRAGVDALFCTTEAEIRYFTGFRTLFWQSPTRYWYLIIPRDELPIAIIPSIGLDLMRTAFVGSIEVFNSPASTFEELPLLKKHLSAYQSIAMPMGEESSLRMPLTLLNALNIDFVDATPIIKSLRMIKSEAEIDVIKNICTIAATSFAEVPKWLEASMDLNQVFSRFKQNLLAQGAEDVPYLVGGAGRDGYSDVISPPTAQPLNEGDVVMMDTGASLRGYFCDFDRNFVIGEPTTKVKKAYNLLIDATHVALENCKPGVRCCDVYAAMADVLSAQSNIGRMGHGLGSQLTEWPSIAAHDTTPIQANMVLTIEPAIALSEHTMMVHEENIVIGEDGSTLLTPIPAKW